MDVSMSNQIENQPKTMCSPGEETTLKVRKPYTISKLREKWTDEEHNKFLEALKLHGRAWRKIEEHIGTKTTVQIRSHAQKFFSKVMRESAGGNCEAMKLVDIPPPRPKRKPLHPYPRKSGIIPDKALPVLKKLDKNLMNLEYVCDQENRSPTSVLSTVVSSNACAQDLYDHGRDSASMEDRTKFQLRSALGECGSRISEGKSAMEVDTSDSKEKKMESEAPVTSLKLFGTTVIIDDARKSSCCLTGSAKHCDNLVPQPHDEQVRGDARKDVHAPMLPDGDCAVPGEGSWNTWHCGMPSMFYCFPPQQEHKIVPDTMAPIQVPAWALYSGLTPFPFLHPLNFAPRCSEDVFQKEEGSQSASNEGPDMEARPTSNDAKPSSDDKARGFMPYKRCLAEREAEQADSNKSREDR